MQTLLQERCSHFRSALSKQLIEKDRILGNYMKSLENAITVIKKSQRLIQIMVINDCSQTTQNNDDSGVLKRIISYNKIEQKGGKFCDIHLISPDDIYYHKSAIENCEKIAVIKENQKKFRVIYKQEKGSKLTEWIVDNPELSKDLLSLHNDGTTILDRDKHWKIYALIYEKIKSKNGYIRQNILTPLTNCINNGEYQVTFNDLIARQDCGTIDQAIETIDNAVCKNEPNSLFDKTINSVAGIPSRLFKKNPILNSDYKNINVSIIQIKADKLKEFLNPNIEIKEATQKEALAHLKDKSTFFHRHLLPESLSPDSFDVDLEIIFDNNKSKKNSGLQARVAIDIIQRQKEDTTHYNLTFISANKKTNVLKEKGINHSELTVEFISLTGKKVLDKLKEITSNSINLEIFDTKEHLLEIIRSVDTKYIELCSFRKKGNDYENMKELIDKRIAEKKIREITEDKTTMTLIDMNKETIEKIIAICPNVNFTVHFIDVDSESLLTGLNDESINVHFDRLGREIASTLITQIRKVNLDFNLTFKNLKRYQVQELIELAPIKQEDIEVFQSENFKRIIHERIKT